MGFKTVQVVVVTVDDAQARILAQTLNRSRGADDPEAYARLLNDVLMHLGEEEGAAALTGYLPETEASLERALHALPMPGDPPIEDDLPAVPKRPKSKRGVVYELGPHRLMCGDCRDPDHVATLMAGAHAEVLWTDPPYGVSYVGKTKDAMTIENDAPGDLEALLAAAFGAVDSALAPSARFYIATPAGPNGTVFRAAIAAAGWRFAQSLVWVKQTLVLGHSDYHYQHEDILYGWKPGKGRAGRGAHDGTRWYGDNSQTSVFNIDRPTRSADHPTAKPVDLIIQQLLNSSKRGAVVLDCFAGSGSTMIACEQSGRRCYAMELDPGYCDVIRQRYADHALAAELAAANITA